MENQKVKGSQEGWVESRGRIVGVAEEIRRKRFSFKLYFLSGKSHYQLKKTIKQKQKP